MNTMMCQITAATIMMRASSVFMPERVMPIEPMKAPAATLAIR